MVDAILRSLLQNCSNPDVEEREVAIEEAL